MPLTSPQRTTGSATPTTSKMSPLQCWRFHRWKPWYALTPTSPGRALGSFTNASKQSKGNNSYQTRSGLLPRQFNLLPTQPAEFHLTRGAKRGFPNSSFPVDCAKLLVETKSMDAIRQCGTSCPSGDLSFFESVCSKLFDL
jgi:hypothetical protein